MAQVFSLARSTTSVEEAERSMSEVYGPMTLTAEPPREFRYAAAVTGDGRFTLGRLLYSGSCRSGTDGFPQIVVAHAARGRHHWTLGREAGLGTVPFLVPPGRWLDAEFSDVDFLTLTFRLESLTETAERLLGTDHVRLDLDAGLRSSPDAQLVANLLRYLDQSLRARPDVFANPLIRASAMQHAATLVLSAFRLLPEQKEPGPQPTMSRALRRAVAFIDDNARRPITVADIADASRLSVRGLQAAFRRDLGTTPMAYLRSARLDGAHRDLLNAHPDRGDTVDAIAHRWGFGHPARFAAAYRTAFGEYPAATLRR